MASPYLPTEQAVAQSSPEVLGIERQRKLADLLTAQGFNQPQGQMISGHYVAPSFTQQLAPMANILAGNAISGRADVKQQELAAALRGKQKEVVDAFTNAKTFKEKFAAASSEYAPSWLKTAGAEMLKTQKAGEGEVISERNFDTGAFEPILQGGAKMAPGVREAMQLLGMNKPLDQLTPQELAIVNAKVDQLNRSKASSVNMPPAETAYAREFGTGVAKQDLALKDIAESAGGVIDNVQRQRNLLKSGNVITGFGADQRLALAQFGKAIGATGEGNDLVANTQGLLAGRAGATLDAIKTSNLGSAQGFSNTDRDFLEKAKLGGIKYDAKSLERQLDLEERVARAGLEKWNKRLQELPKSASTPINTNPVQIPPINQSNTGTSPKQPSAIRSQADAILSGGK